MDRKTITLIILGNILTLLLAVGIVFWLFRSSNKQVTLPIQNNNMPGAKPESGVIPSQPPAQNNEPVIVDKKEQIPPIINGVVLELGDTLVIKQYADFDFRFKIPKNEIKSVKFFEKNPSFNQTKMIEAQKAMKEKMSQIKPDDKDSQKIYYEEIQKINNNPELQAYLEKDSDWSQVKVNTQVMIRTEKDNAKTLVIYPPDYPVDYSKAPSENQKGNPGKQ